METHQKPKIRERTDRASGRAKQEAEAAAAAGEQLRQQTQATAIAAASSLPPSATSSPSHEFSFTISLHSSTSTSASSSSSMTPNSNLNSNKAKSGYQSSPAIDLTPADEIFFQGHLIPLHLLSNLPAQCSSANSSFTHPVRELLKETKKPNDKNNNINNSQSSNDSDDCICINCDDTKGKGRSFNGYEYNSRYQHKQYDQRRAEYTPNGRVKAKSFSLFSLAKRGKDVNTEAKEVAGEEKQHKRNIKFEVGQFLKRSVRMVRPLMFFKGRKESVENNHRTHRKNHSFSGNLMSSRSGVVGRGRSWDLMMKRRAGQFSAPASMRTSPTNSGILASQNNPIGNRNTPCSNDSTMEELQAAIQTAIAHCKNSIASQEKLNNC